MSSECHMCSTDCVSDYITCIKCDSFLHFKCMHAAGIIIYPWSNSNKLTAYALYIYSPLIINTKKYGAHSPWFNNDLVILRVRHRYRQLEFKRSKYLTHLEYFKNIRSLYKKKIISRKIILLY